MKKSLKKKTNKKKDTSMEDGFSKFIKTVPPDSDPTTMILRSHLLSEYYLDRLLVIDIPRGDIIVDSRLQFYDKLLIVESLNVLTKDIVDSLRKLNKVRNDSSHVLDYEISENDIDIIGRPLGVAYLKYKKDYGKNKKIFLHFVLLALMARLCATVDGRVYVKVHK